MFLREKLAWILVAALALACVACEMRAENAELELAKMRDLKERVEQHNKAAIRRFMNRDNPFQPE
jgi:hypothetical protein